MSINLSAQQLNDANLIDKVKTAMKEHSYDPNLLELEITESSIMKNPQSASDTLNTFCDMGIHLAVDDFGTGYSSLSYLKRFPIHTLKIDRSFVGDIPEDQDDAGIVKAIISMAKSLKLNVIAEGVETKEQLEFLRDEGCDLIQGFYFSRPVPAKELASLLAVGKHKDFLSNTG